MSADRTGEALRVGRTHFVDVALCVNDPDTGNDAGRVCAVHLDGIELDSPYLDDGPVFRRERFDRIRVGRRLYPIAGYKSWYGNWCWDGVIMRRTDARALVAHLFTWGFTIAAAPLSSDLLPADFGHE